MKKLASISLALLLALALVPTTSQTVDAQEEITGELTGNIGINSQYVFRGVLESGEPVVNGGIDYSISGFYAGYWASELGTTPGTSGGPGYAAGALENDFYAGYAGEAGPLSFDVGALQYYYTQTDGSDANEVYGSLGFGPASLGVTYTTKDASWTNSGDVFATLSASGTVLGDLSADGLIRFNSLGADGPAYGSSVEDGLAQLEVGLSHPIGETGADWSFRYIANDSENDFGGPDNHIVLGLSYGFGIAE